MARGRADFEPTPANPMIRVTDGDDGAARTEVRVGLIAADGLPVDLVAGLETDDAVKEAACSYRASDNS